jgi:hypothetical protein
LAKNTQARLYQEGPAVLFEKFRLDVLVLPTESSSSRLGAVGRLPVGSVPLGYDDINPPFSMAFVGRWYARDLSFAPYRRMKQTSLLARCHICWSKVRHGVAGSRRIVCGNSIEDGTTLLDISER